ncbi:three prime repair exonuclease 2-like [Aphomia sociella]
MVKVNTYVFVDIEPTGLPPEELNKTKITEISFIAVNRENLLDTQPGKCPRVHHKLNLCVYPRRMIGPVCTEITKLSNELLEFQSTFNLEVYKLVNSFLNVLTKPVCLIAQNGMHFDFPILKCQLEKLNVCFMGDLLCADCLHAFYDIENKEKCDVDLIDPDVKLLDHDQWDSDFVYDNEIGSDNLISIDSDLDLREEDRLRNSRRHMPWHRNDKPQNSYRLGKIYERIFKVKPVCLHRAENDSILALKIAVVMGEKFVQWVDKNYCYFSEVKAMTPGVPLGY